ncbi:MAG: peptide chain release factor 1 [Patescibacteria group bacterium]|nr:peptide chain release factor 1 [Patescibacteria group bacterium]MDD5716066.1 peptide chain release factor 1 [Patescibacteria group bacterium]
MNTKREEVQARYEQIERELQDQTVLNDQQKLAKLSREYSDLGELLGHFQELDGVNKSIEQVQRSLKDESDHELREIAAEELVDLERCKRDLDHAINEIINPADPLDRKDTLVEIRAGTGGEEAALFAAELLRMYSRYAEKQGWKTHLVNSNTTGIGGIKETIFEINGSNVYSRLKYESGVHRVQRVPETEKSGRIHTSAATVAILPAAEEIDVELKPEEIDIEATTSSGHGGQSVNTTYSAVRIVHKPTGMTVICQDERSQRQNKEKALQVLRSRLLALEQERQQKERSENRKNQIGTGDRSEKIRTYNYPQNRVTDHRIKKSYHNISVILDGDLDPIINDIKQAESRE